MKEFLFPLPAALLVAFSFAAVAIDPEPLGVELCKPEHAVNHHLRAAQPFPPKGWCDGKYWHIWAEKKAVPAHAPELIWYALHDAPPVEEPTTTQRLPGRPTDWTTDDTGTHLIFFVDPIGNWNNGHFVIYRRNEHHCYEFVGSVWVGVRRGYWSEHILIEKDGFTLHFVDAGTGTSRSHKFYFNNLRGFCLE